MAATESPSSLSKSASSSRQNLFYYKTSSRYHKAQSSGTGLAFIRHAYLPRDLVQE